MRGESKYSPYHEIIADLCDAGCSYKEITDAMRTIIGDEANEYSVGYYIRRHGLKSKITQGARKGRIDIPNCNACENMLRVKSADGSCYQRVCLVEKRLIPSTTSNSPMWCEKREIDNEKREEYGFERL